ncbi:MAG: hypothetical protein RL430_1915 [Actinomycetota bacterium]|jgi:RecG-like helicase|nr:DNA-binding protein [Actinomycetota bacterium]
MAFGFGRKKKDGAPADAEVFPALATIEPREHVRVKGQIFKLKTRPSQGMPALEVTLVDDTGSVTVVWSGRRSIGGVGLGRRIIIEGVPMKGPRGLTFTNPSYELL